MMCPDCGYAFPSKEKEKREHEEKAANVAILSGEVVKEDVQVTHVEYQVWAKRGAPEGAPKTVRVTYYTDDMLVSYSEWLCPEHTGYARQKFEKWWRAHAVEGIPLPSTAEEACEHAFAGLIRPTTQITVKRISGQRYPEVVDWVLGEVQPPTASEEVFDGYDDLPF